MAFHEVLLPLPFALGSSGGPERRVDITALASGREVRNTPWAHGRRRYDIGGTVRGLDEMHALVGFFEARGGQLHGFRFRDFVDWKSCAPSAAAAPTDQVIGLGDGVTTGFQLLKSYGDGTASYVRAITKPVAGSVRVALDGVEAAPADFAVDSTSGKVVFALAPAAGVAVSAGFHFDTPVRFDSARLDVTVDSFAAGRLVSAPLIEVID